MARLIGTGITLAGAALAAIPVLREARRERVSKRLCDQAQGRFAELGRGPTRYRWQGTVRGPVAVCVHGLTTPSFVWQGLMPHLERIGFRVLTYDLYGRGYSARPRGAQTPAFFVRQLRELMDHEGLTENVTLIGYSMGGVIATAFAAEHGHRLRRLILIAPAGMGHDLGPVARLAADWPLLGDWAFHMAWPARYRREIESARNVPGTIPNIADLQLTELSRQGYVRSVLSSLRHTLRRQQDQAHHKIARDGLPVAAIWGRDDTTIPISAMATLTQWNRDTRQEIIESAGHGLVYTHSPEVAGAIRNVIL